MSLLALICGLVALAAAVGGAVFLVVRTREALRSFRAFGRALEAALGRLDAEAQRLAASGERAAGAGGRLEESVSRLAVSQARLAVLLAAAGDFRASITGVTSVLRK